MKITVPTNSVNLDTLLTGDQGFTILQERNINGDFQLTILNPATNANNVYVERFDGAATATTSLPIEPGSSISLASRSIANIKLIADVAAADIVLG